MSKKLHIYDVSYKEYINKIIFMKEELPPELKTEEPEEPEEPEGVRILDV